MAVERDGDSYTTRRESREALVLATLDFGPRRDPKLDTTLAFFDHMLEMLGWYADINVDASYEVRTYRLMHVVMEDVGLALGAAAGQAISDRIADGAFQQVARPRRDVKSAAAPLPECRLELPHVCLAGRQVRKSDEAIHQAVPQNARTGLVPGRAS